MMMPVSVNPITLQYLFYQVLDDLEYAENQLYNDEISRLMKQECAKKRQKYIHEFEKILKGNAY